MNRTARCVGLVLLVLFAVAAVGSQYVASVQQKEYQVLVSNYENVTQTYTILISYP